MSMPLESPSTPPPPPLPHVAPQATGQPPRRLLITAGPTHEPIDLVRYLGNRSSGRLGIALADHAAHMGWQTTLLLGPTPRTPAHSSVALERFQTTADLDRLLANHFPHCDCLVMAAAVADYRPARPHAPPHRGPHSGAEHGPDQDKLRRTSESLTLRLEPTPDLLAACAARKRPGQLVVGFALEPRARLLASASDKLARKRLDMIVANPLETMDSDSIEATLLQPITGQAAPGAESTPGAIAKSAFASWLLSRIDSALLSRR